MNERIKELAREARNYALDEKRIYERMHNTEQCMEEYREVYNKKFAELLVRECANYITHKATIETLLGERLMEHFGVEE
jgi:DNA integrity scanning protein DisA with diadenylate cyclase activity